MSSKRDVERDVEGLFLFKNNDSMVILIYLKIFLNVNQKERAIILHVVVQVEISIEDKIIYLDFKSHKIPRKSFRIYWIFKGLLVEEKIVKNLGFEGNN